MNGEVETGTCSTDTLCKRCNVVRETPFCPVCGERLTDNLFLGHNMQQLEQEQEDAGRRYRDVTNRITEVERRWKEEVKPLQETQQQAANLCGQIREAFSWARKYDIQHPDARRF